MKNLALIAAAALTAATFGVGAIALADDTGGDFAKADSNNDKLVTFDEARGPYPTLTEDIFKQADTNGDGNLDEGEFTGLVGLTAGADAQTDSSAAPATDVNPSSSSGNDGTSSPSSSVQ